MSDFPQLQPRHRHLDRKDVEHLVGDLEDATIAAVLATGATYPQIEQPLTWIGRCREEPRLDGEGMTPEAEQVCEILLADPAYEMETIDAVDRR